MSSFGDRLKSLRQEKDIRQIDLARELGLRQTTIANYEKGLRFPNEEILIKLGDYFNISLDYLLGRETILLNTYNDLSNSADPIVCNDSPICLAAVAEDYLNALLDTDKPLAVKTILDALQQGVSIGDLYMKVFEPTLKKIGNLWECSAIHVGQEHYCSEVTQLIMSKLYVDKIPVFPKNHRILAMATHGEYHHIGIKMLADLLELDGWKSYYLGANIPSESVIKMIQEESIDIVAISATMTFNINSVETLIRTIRSVKSCKNIKIMVGGGAFNVDDELWKLIGADAYAPNAIEAVKIANDLIA